jgi:hypothetical protein
MFVRRAAISCRLSEAKRLGLELADGTTRHRIDIACFDTLLAVQPTVPIDFTTSLHVPPAWSPKTQIADLEAYRQVAREIVLSRKDPNMHLIEGLDLIDHDPKLFDAVAVHPNDQGFAQMGERLAKQMKQPGK